MFMVSPLKLAGTASGFSFSGFNNIDNYAGVYGAFQQDAPYEQFLGPGAADHLHGGILSLLGGLTEGFFAKETVSKVGDGGRMAELGQCIGTTLSSCIPLLAGLFSPPVAALLLMTHNASSITSGVRTLSDGLMNGNITEILNGGAYLIDGITGGRAAFLKTTMAKSLTGFQQARSDIGRLETGIKATIDTHIGSSGVDPKVLFAEVLEQGPKHKDWNALRSLTVEPKVKLAQVFTDSRYEAQVKKVLQEHVDRQNKPGLLQKALGRKKKLQQPNVDTLYAELKEQGEKSLLWKDVSIAEISTSKISLEEALAQRGAAIESRQKYLLAIRQEAKQIAADHVQTSGSLWEKSTSWLGANFKAGRERVMAGATVNTPS